MRRADPSFGACKRALFEPLGKGRLINLLMAAVAAASLLQYVTTSIGGVGHTTFDDAYMVTRYARHWLDGHGFCWNIGDGPSYGITSPAYLFLVTAVMGLTGWPDARVLTVVSYGCGLLAALTLVRLGFRVFREMGGRGSWLPLLTIPLIVSFPSFRFHSLTGMETTLSLFLPTHAWLRRSFPPDKSRPGQRFAGLLAAPALRLLFDRTTGSMRSCCRPCTGW